MLRPGHGSRAGAGLGVADMGGGRGTGPQEALDGPVDEVVAVNDLVIPVFFRRFDDKATAWLYDQPTAV
ncbi:hypothetical protein ACIBI9_20610 [Nonomuraea sp. NPDC050451]|uniref:hypothetical protein n=1 Tax=Nonomuraea sp. NPDC050451 TaxID=3364364 RepID=UPI0037958854